MKQKWMKRLLAPALCLLFCTGACTSARDGNDPRELDPAYTGQEFESREILNDEDDLKLRRERMDQQSSNINNVKIVTEEGVDRTSTTPPELRNERRIENGIAPVQTTDTLQRVRP